MLYLLHPKRLLRVNHMRADSPRIPARFNRVKIENFSEYVPRREKR